MPTPEHEAYRSSVLEWFRKHGEEPGVADELERYGDALLVLWHLDLSPARPVLQRCYAPSPRGARPRDPIGMLRLCLLAVLVVQTSLNKWVRDLSASRVLRVLGGLGDERRPGVGTFYDFFHRLHDGPVRKCCEHVERPSDNERRRAKSPRSRPKKPPKKKGAPKGTQSESKKQRRRRKTQRDKDPVKQSAAVDTRVTGQLVERLRAADQCANPDDLLGRLGDILLDVGVAESARRGLLGDLDALLVGGDGSPLRTGAARYGRKTCDHPRRERCGCPRIFDDPDAQFGWDAHRECHFFGHHFYELSTSVAGHDLPLALRLDPGNESDFTASLATYDWLRKALRQRGWDWTIAALIQDAGHDGELNYRYPLEHGVAPVIPLARSAPAVHPSRPDVRLSKRGAPLCEAGVEMAPWGSAGADRRVFICPVKAKRIGRCPLAPEHDPTWVCRPDQKYGPAVSLRVSDDPRLCPPIPRNRPRFQQLMNLRSGCERSNAVKKETFRLEQARHRRASFWMIRLHLIALVQHARAWVASESADDLVALLLGRQRRREAA